jgi:hypothetical protein
MSTLSGPLGFRLGSRKPLVKLSSRAVYLSFVFGPLLCYGTLRPLLNLFYPDRLAFLLASWKRLIRPDPFVMVVMGVMFDQLLALPSDHFVWFGGRGEMTLNALLAASFAFEPASPCVMESENASRPALITKNPHK